MSEFGQGQMEQMSRRKFLRAGGLAVAGAAGAATAAYLLHDTPKRETGSDAEKFEKEGLTAFLQAHQLFQRLQADFFYQPEKDQRTMYSLKEPLKRVARGEHLSSSERTHYVEGWGTNTAQKEHDSQQKVDRMSFVDTTKQDFTQKVKDRYAEMATLFPVLNLASPATIIIKDHTGSGQYFPGSKIEIFPPSSEQRTKLFNIVLQHEEEHAFDYSWETVKQYMNKESFAEYMQAKLKALQDITHLYFSGSLVDALQFPGFVEQWRTSQGDISVKDIDEKEAYYKKTFGLDLQALHPIDNPRLNSWRPVRLIHTLGNKMLELRKKDALTEQEKKFLDPKQNKYLAELMNNTVGALNHILSAPTAINDPFPYNQISDDNMPDHPIHAIYQELYVAKLKAFSSLPREAFDGNPLQVAQEKFPGIQ